MKRISALSQCLLVIGLAACGPETPRSDAELSHDTFVADSPDAGPVHDAGGADVRPADVSADAVDGTAPDGGVPDAPSDTRDIALADASFDAGPTVTLRLLLPAGEVEVGVPFRVGCRAEDDTGAAVSGVPTTVFTTAEDVRSQDDGWVAEQPGEIVFGCRDRRGTLPDAALGYVTIVPTSAARVETRIDVESVEAGTPFHVACEAFSSRDMAMGEVGATVQAVGDDGTTSALHTDGMPMQLQIAGTYSLTCILPDGTTGAPHALNVVAGPPMFARVGLPEESFVPVAGVVTEYPCTGEDRYGNATGPLADAEATVGYGSPLGRESARARIDGMTVDLRSVENNPHTIRCGTLDASSVNSVVVSVVPGIAIEVGGFPRINGGSFPTSLFPDDPESLVFIAPPGSFVYPQVYAQDAYRNRIALYQPNEDWEISMTPHVAPTAGGWTVTEEGRYVFEVRYVGDRAPALDPYVVEFYIDRGGPLMSCRYPTNNAWTDLTPGEEITFELVADDAHEITSMTVNGVEAEHQGEGVYTAPHTVHAGVNIIDVQAGDAVRQTSGLACFFIAGYGYQPTDVPLAGTMRIGLGSALLNDEDDTDADGPESLTDLLRGAITSDALIGGLEATLEDNPVLWEGTAGAPPLELEGSARYRGNFETAGPNDAWVEATEEGLSLSLEIQNVGFDVRVISNLFGLVDGRLTAPRIYVHVTLSLQLEDGVLVASVDDHGGVVFEPLEGEFDNRAFALAFIAAEPELRASLVAEFDAMIAQAMAGLTGDDALGGGALDMGSTFEVEAIDDRTPFTVNLSLAPGSTLVSNGGFWILLDSMVRVLHDDPPTRSAPGVPAVGDGMTILDGDQFAARINLNLINQAMVALWEAGYFDADLYDFGTLFEFAEGASVGRFRIRPELPPLVYARDGRVVLGLGGVATDVLDVFYGEGIVDARLGAEISARPAIDADGNLVFDDVQVDGGTASLQPAGFSASDYQRVIDSVLGVGLTDVAREVFNTALPALPVLRVEGSADTAALGIPEGTALVISDFVADMTDDWIFVDGRLSVE